jgi:membrane-bound lytic murein transglycosylase A
VSRRFRRLACGLIALALSACATLPAQEPSPTTSMSRLPGWDGEDHAAAFDAVRQACAASPRALRGTVCAETLSRGSLDEGAARSFLETRFRAEPIEGEGLLTGYFSPAYEARTTPEGDFTAPLRSPPADPPALDRGGIERAPTTDALA